MPQQPAITDNIEVDSWALQVTQELNGTVPVQANPATTSATLTTISIGDTNYVLSAPPFVARNITAEVAATLADVAVEATAVAGMPGTYDLNFVLPPSVIPNPPTGEDEYVLNVNASGLASWIANTDDTVDLPDAPTAENEYILNVDSAGDAAWTINTDDTVDLPDAPSTEEEYVLNIDATGDATWIVNTDDTVDLPDAPTAEEEYVLNVDASGDAAWIVNTDDTVDLPDAPTTEEEYVLNVDATGDATWIVNTDDTVDLPDAPSTESEYFLNIDSTGDAAWEVFTPATTTRAYKTITVDGDATPGLPSIIDLDFAGGPTTTTVASTNESFLLEGNTAFSYTAGTAPRYDVNVIDSENGEIRLPVDFDSTLNHTSAENVDALGQSIVDTLNSNNEWWQRDIIDAAVGIPAISGDTLALSNNSGALVYTRTGTTWTQQQLLEPPFPQTEIGFGHALAIDGDTLIVSSGLGGGSSDSNRGAAYIFTRTGTTWTEQARLEGSDVVDHSSFGFSVAIEGDTAIVGASAFLDPGQPGDVYVFTRTGTTWTEQAKLAGPSGTQAFGWSVDINGDTIIVGDDVYIPMPGLEVGGAFVYTRTGTTWTQQQILLPSTSVNDSTFGHAVSIDGDTAIVSAPREANEGFVYIFTRAGTTWTEQARLQGSETSQQDRLGRSITVIGDTAVIGGSAREPGLGASYVFTRTGTTWTQQTRLVAADTTISQQFGPQTVFDGSTIVVAAGSIDASTYVFEAATTDLDDWIYDATSDSISTEQGEADRFQLEITSTANDGLNTAVTVTENNNGTPADTLNFTYIAGGNTVSLSETLPSGSVLDQTLLTGIASDLSSAAFMDTVEDADTIRVTGSSMGPATITNLEIVSDASNLTPLTVTQREVQVGHTNAFNLTVDGVAIDALNLTSAQIAENIAKQHNSTGFQGSVRNRTTAELTGIQTGSQTNPVVVNTWPLLTVTETFTNGS